MSPIFREMRTFDESMELPVLSNVDGPDEIYVGEMISIERGIPYQCLIMEDEKEIRIIMSMSSIRGAAHLELIDKLCIEAHELVISYVASFYLHNEKVLRRVSISLLADVRSRAAALDPDIYQMIRDYPDGTVQLDKEFLLVEGDKELVKAILNGELKRMPDECLDLLRDRYTSDIYRYVVSSFHHSHLCLEKPFFDGSTSSYRGMRIAMPLLYLRDVLMTMNLIPFEETVIIRQGMEVMAELDPDPQHSWPRLRCLDHPYIEGSRSLYRPSLSRPFEELLCEDSNGLFDRSFNWEGLILTGSTIFSLLLATFNHDDYDVVVLGSGTKEDLMLIHMERFSHLLPNTELILTEKSFRLRLMGDGMKSVDLYFGNKLSISRYHSAPTNAFYDGESVCLYPRALHCLATGVMSDLVPLSRDRGLALRVKTYQKYREVGMRMHIWHDELRPHTWSPYTWTATNKTISKRIRSYLGEAR